MKVISFFFALMISFSLFSQKVKPFYGPFPYPAPNKKMLFYLQRTINRNTLIYELNCDAAGSPNPVDPVKIYWINFEEGGEKDPLTFLQRKFAYGVRSNIIDQEKGIYELTLVSYDRVKLYIMPGKGENVYHAEVLIKKKIAILDRIFIQITGGTYMNPIVSFIELTGHDPESGKEVSERIKTTR